MTLETDSNAFKMWASGVVAQIKTLRIHVDQGLKDVRSAILQLALTDAEVNRLREDTDKLKKRVKALEDAELVRTAKLDTIKALNKWMVGIMSTILVSVVIGLIKYWSGI